MRRDEIVKLCRQEILGRATRLFGTSEEALKLFPDHEGCENLVYEYERNGKALVLRISFRPDRSAEMIQAELHYITYLAEHGVRVAAPVPSLNGNTLETIVAGGIPFHAVCFEKGVGMRVPDNDYRYRQDAPIEQYFQNWGRVLGQMHALAKAYHSASGGIQRPDWFELKQPALSVEERVPERLSLVRGRILSILEEIRVLPRERDAYGLIHGDFNDGNFTVDYSNGDITVFDFDDCCAFYFVYELASAWEGGIGRVMFQGVEKRVAFMDHYMEQVMAGYTQENAPSADWQSHLQLFLKLVQVEEFLHFIQYIDGPDEEMGARLNYLITCIEGELPYLGFFETIFSPERPFMV